MKRLLLFIAGTSIVIGTLAGCATRSDFTAISGKNLNLANIKVDKSMSKGRTSGEDCTHIIIFIPTGGPATIDEALDRALEPKQANLLLDAVVRYHWFYIPYIYGQECWKAEGVAYDTFK
jgi:hypothetical protein